MENNLVKLLAEEVMDGWEKRGHDVYEGKYPAYLIDEYGVLLWEESANNNRYWNPLEDWNDCMMLVEQMREDGWKFGLITGTEENKDQAIFWKSADDLWYSTWEDEPKEAICKAIAKARGIEYE